MEINVTDVSSVLIGGQWLDVVPGSFDFERVRFIRTPEHPDQQPTMAGHAFGLGFVCEGKDGRRVAGPAESIEAVQVGQSTSHAQNYLDQITAQ